MGVPSTPPEDKLEEDRSPEDQFKDEVSPSNQVPPMRGLKTPNLNYSWSRGTEIPLPATGHRGDRWRGGESTGSLAEPGGDEFFALGTTFARGEGKDVASLVHITIFS